MLHGLAGFDVTAVVGRGTRWAKSMPLVSRFKAVKAALSWRSNTTVSWWWSGVTGFWLVP